MPKYKARSYGTMTVRMSLPNCSSASSVPLIASASNDTCSDDTRNVEHLAPGHLDQHGQLLEKMVVRADDFDFVPQQFPIRVNLQRLVSNSGYDRTAHDAETLHGLPHRLRQADELERDIYTFAFREATNLGHRVNLTGVDRDGAVLLASFSLSSLMSTAWASA
jgi:hypothetical protein